MKLKRIIVGTASLAILILGISSPAPAAIAAEHAAAISSVNDLVAASVNGITSCGVADIEMHQCVPYTAATGQDPMAQAAIQLVREGKQDAAEAFISNVAKAGGSIKADMLRGAAFDETQTSAKTSASGSKYHDGQLANAYEWDLYTTLTYGYCTTSNCQAIGSTNFDLWQTLYDYGTPGYGVGLAGTTQVKSGNSLIQTDYTCKTFYEIWPADQVLHDWSNCRGVVSPNPFSVRMVPWEGWDQGSAQGSTYHLEVIVGFKVSGGTNGTTFRYLFNSNSYQIMTPSNAEFLT